MRCLSLSEEQRVRQFLMHEKMGDRRPTQFLRYFRTLAVPSVPSNFLRTLMTNRLPPNIQAIIATQAQVVISLVHTFRFSTGREVSLITGQSSGTQESTGVFTQPGRLAGREFTGRLPGSTQI
jgi:hypothetical protein